MSRRTGGQVMNKPSMPASAPAFCAGAAGGAVREETSMVEDDFGPWDD
jgi:hypothetical protein